MFTSHYIASSATGMLLQIDKCAIRRLLSWNVLTGYIFWWRLHSSCALVLFCVTIDHSLQINLGCLKSKFISRTDHSESLHEERSLLLRSIEGSKDILRFIDDRVDDHERREKLLHIYNKLDPKSQATHNGKKFKVCRLHMCVAVLK